MSALRGVSLSGVGSLGIRSAQSRRCLEGRVGIHRAWRLPQCSWKAPLLFLDSPSCLNFNLPRRPQPCGKCFLIDFVPVPFLEENMPCHFIPLNEHGETIDSLERQAHQTEMEDAVKQWLRATIERLTTTLGVTSPATPTSSRSARP